MNKKQFLRWCLPLLLLSACANEPEKIALPDLKADMIAAEIAFSTLSQQIGTRAALMQYIDSNGVLLRPNAMPMVGADAIDFISQANDANFKMVWQPKGGTVAASGELGYTFGVYSFSPQDKDTVIYGNYVNVWKKQTDGTWKLLLDSGNEGIEAP